MTDLNLLFQRPAMWPVALLILAVVLVVWWTYRRTYPPLPGGYRLLLAGIRTVVVILTGVLVFEPLLVSGGERSRAERVALLVDRSASMLLPVSSLPGDTTSRLAAAQAILGDSQDSIIKRYSFGRGLAELDKLDELSAGRSDDRTDLAGALERLFSSPGSNWDRVVLVGDGRVNAGGDPLGVLPVGVRVDAVLMGDSPPPGEISLAGVEQLAPAYEDGEVELELTLARGAGGPRNSGPAMVDIFLDGRKVAERRVELAGAGAGMVSSRVSFDSPEAGGYWLEAEIRDGNEQWTALDNRRLLRLDVRKSKRTFLLISNSPDWDLTFTARALSANEDWNVETILVLGGSSGRTNIRRRSGDGKYGPGSLPTAEELTGSSLVLLHGELNRFGRNLLDRLAPRMAAGEFALVLWPAGAFDPRALPPGINRVLPLAPGAGTMVPQEAPQTPAGLYTTGRYGVLNALGGGGEIDGLPPVMTVYRGLQLSRQAEILARAGSRGPMAGDGPPVLAVAPSGGVRTAIVAAQGLWRWHMQRQSGSPEEAALYGRMWQELAEWLSSAGKRSPLTLEPERYVFGRGEPLRFSGMLAGDGDGETQINVALWRVDSTGAPDTLAVRAVTAGSDIFSLELGSLPPGRYSYGAVAMVGAETLTTGGELAVEQYSAEFADPRPDSTLFAALVSQSGGRLVRPDQAAEVLAREPSVTETVLSSTGLARLNWLYWLIVALLAAEWALRRRKALS